MSAEASKDRQREGKWHHVLGPEIDPHSGKPSLRFRDWRKAHSRIFERRIMKGLPDICRGRVWYELLNSKHDESPGPIVETLYKHGTPECDRAIRADIARTMPLIAGFSMNNVSDALYRVLRAYANADEPLGYSQGMAFYAGVFLQYMPELKAFWAFWQLFQGNKHALREYYLNNGQTIKDVSRVWTFFLERKFPKVHAHFKQMGVMPMSYLSGWFLSGFQSLKFAPQFRLRVLDRQVAFGTRALVSCGLAIVACLKKDLEVKSKDECMRCLENPAILPDLRDWRAVIKKFDTVMISKSDYKNAFRLLGLVECP
jgi:hypothetical protein